MIRLKNIVSLVVFIGSMFSGYGIAAECEAFQTRREIQSNFKSETCGEEEYEDFCKELVETLKLYINQTLFYPAYRKLDESELNEVKKRTLNFYRNILNESTLEVEIMNAIEQILNAKDAIEFNLPDAHGKERSICHRIFHSKIINRRTELQSKLNNPSKTDNIYEINKGIEICNRAASENLTQAEKQKFLELNVRGEIIYIKIYIDYVDDHTCFYHLVHELGHIIELFLRDQCEFLETQGLLYKKGFESSMEDVSLYFEYKRIMINGENDQTIMWYLRRMANSVRRSEWEREYTTRHFMKQEENILTTGEKEQLIEALSKIGELEFEDENHGYRKEYIDVIFYENDSFLGNDDTKCRKNRCFSVDPYVTGFSNAIRLVKLEESGQSIEDSLKSLSKPHEPIRIEDLRETLAALRELQGAIP